MKTKGGANRDMWFRVRLIDHVTRKQIKQKTFWCESWDEAEIIAHEFWDEIDSLADMALSVLDIRRSFK